MIRYLLDTDIVSQAGKQTPNANVTGWLRSVDDQELAISAITVRERWEGAEKARQMGSPRAMDIAIDVDRMVAAYDGRILSIDQRAARRWAELLVPDKSRADDKCQIAIASTHGLTLVSLNAKDMKGKGAAVLNPGRKPPKLYMA